MPLLKSSILLVRKGGVSSSLHGGSVDVITLPDESVDDTDEKMLENKVFVECGVI